MFVCLKASVAVPMPVRFVGRAGFHMAMFFVILFALKFELDEASVI